MKKTYAHPQVIANNITVFTLTSSLQEFEIPMEWNSEKWNSKKWVI